MKLGINLGYVCRDGLETPQAALFEAALLCKRSGFGELDFLTNVRRKDWEAHAAAFREFADEQEIVIHQSHAPFNRYNPPETDADFRVLLDRSVQTAAILGSKYLVIHADEYRPQAGEDYDSARVVDAMAAFFAPVVEKAAALGVTVAVENLFEDRRYGPGRSRCCSTVEEVTGVIERLREYGDVGCCWDFGHAHVSFCKNDAEALRACAKYVVCTHVHDNNHGDEHRLPFLGSIDWKTIMPVLCGSGYAGNLTLELVYGAIPASLMPDYLDYARKTCETLLSLA